MFWNTISRHKYIIGAKIDLDAPPLTRVCNKCKEEKERKEFEIHAPSSGGIKATCRECVRKKRLIRCRGKKGGREKFKFQ